MRHHSPSTLLRRCALLVSACCLLIAFLLMPTASRAADLDSLLAYDPALPLNLKVHKREFRHGAYVEDISYAGAGGKTVVQATLVRPIFANAPYAGVVWGHWFEPAATNSNRSQFVREAAALSRLGVVSLMPDALWSDLSWFDKRSWRNDFAATVQQAKDFRRTLDVLLAQSGVDAQRIAFVGHDFSAMHGALIAGVEKRVKAYVLIAGTSRWADWYLFGAADGVPQGNELTTYLAQLALIDPIAALPRNKAPLMFQFGESDFYTPRANFIAFYSAGAVNTTRITTYASEHPMDVTPIRLDRDLWLAEQLGLPLGLNRPVWPAEE
jgi:dienelactone hydrolase